MHFYQKLNSKFQKLLAEISSIDMWDVLNKFTIYYNVINAVPLSIDCANKKVTILKLSRKKRCLLYFCAGQLLLTVLIYSLVLIGNIRFLSKNYSLVQIVSIFYIVSITGCITVPSLIISFRTSVIPNIVNNLSNFLIEILGKFWN